MQVTCIGWGVSLKYLWGVAPSTFKLLYLHVFQSPAPAQQKYAQGGAVNPFHRGVLGNYWVPWPDLSDHDTCLGGGGETATPKNETIEEGKRMQKRFMGYQKGHGWVLKAKIFNGASTLEVALKTIAFLWWKLMRKKFPLGVSGHSVFSSASSLLQCHEPQKSPDVDLSCSKNCGDVARSFWCFETVVCCTRYLISLLDFVT